MKDSQLEVTTDKVFHNKSVLGKNKDLKEFLCAKGSLNCFKWFDYIEIGRKLYL